MRKLSDQDVMDELGKLDILIDMLQARRFELDEDLKRRVRRRQQRGGQ